MVVKHAKEVARQWVIDQGSSTPGFRGAFYHGSINWLAEDAALSATSDVDVVVVLNNSHLPVKSGKFLYHDVLLDVSCLSEDQIGAPEQILSQYRLAGSFKGPSIILDPTGRLTRVQTAVSREYCKRKWVYKRCEDARDNALHYLLSPGASAPLHEQVSAWLFGTGVTTHVLLAAGLKNPTVRKRYLATRELLGEYDRLDFYETLLEMLGCAKMSHRRAEQHLGALTEAFDAAQSVVKTPYRFAADFSDCARPIALEGSRELIERGDHREAIFWIVATYSRCEWVLSHDAPAETQEKFRRGYERLLGDLGIHCFADLERRCEQVKGLLPDVWRVAEAIMAENRQIEVGPDAM